MLQQIDLVEQNEADYKKSIPTVNVCSVHHCVYVCKQQFTINLFFLVLIIVYR